MKISRFLATVSLILGASLAQAGVIADFSAAPWGGADGQATATYGGVTVSVLAPADGTLSYSAGDGLGITSRSGPRYDRQADEIDWAEVMGISLGADTYISSINLSNLFQGEVLSLVTEQGRYSIDDGATWIGFTSNAADGDFTLGINATADTIRFAAVTFIGGFFSHEYSVKSINGGRDAVSVPEPGTLTLLGAGLLGLVLLRRRKAA